MPQLWQGRASKAVDSRVNDFNSSIRFDARMIEQDIQGSLVHSAMLGRQGIISRQDVDDIHKGLHSILDDLHSGALEIDPNAEDVHTFVEQTLTARVGDAGKRLHTGRSRNDQVALDIRLNLRAASEHIQGQIKELITVLCDQAEKGAGYVMPGYTHLQRAQPGDLRPPADGLRLDAAARLGRFAGRHPPHGRRVPAGQRRTGGHDLPAGPLLHRRTARLCRAVRQLHRRRVGPRLLH